MGVHTEIRVGRGPERGAVQSSRSRGSDRPKTGPRTLAGAVTVRNQFRGVTASSCQACLLPQIQQGFHAASLRQLLLTLTDRACPSPASNPTGPKSGQWLMPGMSRTFRIWDILHCEVGRTHTGDVKSFTAARTGDVNQSLCRLQSTCKCCRDKCD
jgi:hypothetical protein